MIVRSLRPGRRAAALAIAATLALPAVARADGVDADTDSVAIGPQSTIDLGDVAPSALLSLAFDFTLTCANGSHLDPGQAVDLAFDGGVQPTGGQILSVSGGTVGPVPLDWPADGVVCPSPAPVLVGTTAGTVELRAPSVPADDYAFLVSWSRTISPAGGFDGAALRGGTSLTVILDVVTNTPPVLVLPDDATVEGDTVGGWSAVFSATTTDVEDDPDPTPTCSVAPGDTLLLGTTTVDCSVTDRGGLVDRGAFDIRVVDTTAPVLTMPGIQAVTTGSSAGAILDYDPPVVADIVDPQPSVACSPIDGSPIPLGTTTVTCQTTDDSGNTASGSFDVEVRYVAPHTASATWGEPVDSMTGRFAANRGRTIPIKVTLTVDGVVRTSGEARLTVASCSNGSDLMVPLAYGGGRWDASLDTARLVGTCHVVTAWIDGLAAGSFQLELRGAEAAGDRARTR